MKAGGAGKKFREIIARNVEGGGADSAPPPSALLGLSESLERAHELAHTKLQSVVNHRKRYYDYWSWKGEEVKASMEGAGCNHS